MSRYSSYSFKAFIAMPLFLLSLSACSPSQVQTSQATETYRYAQTTIKEVAETLAKEEFHALPVVDESNKLEGIVTTTDLVNYLIDQY